MYKVLKENAVNYITKYNLDPVDSLGANEPELKVYFNGILDLTKQMENYHPGYKEWLIYEYLPNLLSKNNSAGYSIAVNDRYQVIGACVFDNVNNKEINKDKISCLAVDPIYKRLKIGTRLLQNSMDLMGTKMPYMEVSEYNMKEMKPLIDKFNFDLTSVKNSMYRPGVREYIYNQYHQKNK